MFNSQVTYQIRTLFRAEIIYFRISVICESYSLLIVNVWIMWKLFIRFLESCENIIQYFLLFTLIIFVFSKTHHLHFSYVNLIQQRDHMKSFIFFIYFPNSLLTQNNEHTVSSKNNFQKSRFCQKSTFFFTFAHSTERFIIDKNLISDFILISSSSHGIFLEHSKKRERKKKKKKKFTISY